MKNLGKIRFEKVTKSDYQFLYDLLEERVPNENISHKTMPSFKQHIKFIESKSYTVWYIIFLNEQKCGSVYLSKQDEIGFWLKKEFESNQIKWNALKFIFNKKPRKRFLININPKNFKMKKFLEKNKFKLVQHTYELSITKK